MQQTKQKRHHRDNSSPTCNRLPALRPFSGPTARETAIAAETPESDRQFGAPTRTETAQDVAPCSSNLRSAIPISQMHTLALPRCPSTSLLPRSMNPLSESRSKTVQVRRAIALARFCHGSGRLIAIRDCCVHPSHFEKCRFERLSRSVATSPATSLPSSNGVSTTTRVATL